MSLYVQYVNRVKATEHNLRSVGIRFAHDMISASYWVVREEEEGLYERESGDHFTFIERFLWPFNRMETDGRYSIFENIDPTINDPLNFEFCWYDGEERGLNTAMVDLFAIAKMSGDSRRRQESWTSLEMRLTNVNRERSNVRTLWEKWARVCAADLPQGLPERMRTRAAVDVEDNRYLVHEYYQWSSEIQGAFVWWTEFWTGRWVVADDWGMELRNLEMANRWRRFRDKILDEDFETDYLSRIIGNVLTEPVLQSAKRLRGWEVGPAQRQFIDENQPARIPVGNIKPKIAQVDELNKEIERLIAERDRVAEEANNQLIEIEAVQENFHIRNLIADTGTTIRSNAFNIPGHTGVDLAVFREGVAIGAMNVPITEDATTEIKFTDGSGFHGPVNQLRLMQGSIVLAAPNPLGFASDDGVYEHDVELPIAPEDNVYLDMYQVSRGLGGLGFEKMPEVAAEFPFIPDPYSIPPAPPNFHLINDGQPHPLQQIDINPWDDGNDGGNQEMFRRFGIEFSRHPRDPLRTVMSLEDRRTLWQPVIQLYEASSVILPSVAERIIQETANIPVMGANHREQAIIEEEATKLRILSNRDVRVLQTMMQTWRRARLMAPLNNINDAGSLTVTQTLQGRYGSMNLLADLNFIPLLMITSSLYQILTRWLEANADGLEDRVYDIRTMFDVAFERYDNEGNIVRGGVVSSGRFTQHVPLRVFDQFHSREYTTGRGEDYQFEFCHLSGTALTNHIRAQVEEWANQYQDENEGDTKYFIRQIDVSVARRGVLNPVLMMPNIFAHNNNRMLPKESYKRLLEPEFQQKTHFGICLYELYWLLKNPSKRKTDAKERSLQMMKDFSEEDVDFRIIVFDGRVDEFLNEIERRESHPKFCWSVFSWPMRKYMRKVENSDESPYVLIHGGLHVIMSTQGRLSDCGYGDLEVPKVEPLPSFPRRFQLTPLKESKHKPEDDLKNTLIFDFETYPDEDGKMIPYCCCVYGWLGLTPTTRTFYGLTCVKDFVAFLCSIIDKHAFSTTNAKKKINRIYLYGYNNGKFDNMLFVDDLMLYFPCAVIGDHTDMKEVKCYNLVIRDLFKIMGCMGSLASNAVVFTHLRKSDFDHTKANIHTIFDPEFQFEAQEYCMKDCEVTYELFKCFQKKLREMSINLSLNADNIYTLSTLTWKYFRTYFLNTELVIAASSPEVRSIELQSLFGGWTGAAKLTVKNGEAWDASSMYPTVMKFEKVPIRFLKYDATKWNTLVWNVEIQSGWLYKVEYDFPLNLPMQPIPTRLKSGDVVYTLSGEGYIWGSLLKELVNLPEEYKPIKLNILGTWQYECQDIFGAVVDNLYRFKEKATKEDNKPIRNISKLLLNSLFGKCIQQDHMKYSYGHIISMVDRIMSGDQYMMLTKDFVAVEEGLKQSGCGQLTFIGSFITCTARAYLFKFMKRVGLDLVAYWDTDSVFFSGQLEIFQVNPDALGGWKKEYDIDEGIFVGAKLYYVKTKDGNEIKKAKGFKAAAIDRNFYIDLIFDKRLQTPEVITFEKRLGKGVLVNKRRKQCTMISYKRNTDEVFNAFLPEDNDRSFDKVSAIELAGGRTRVLQDVEEYKSRLRKCLTSSSAEGAHRESASIKTKRMLATFIEGKAVKMPRILTANQLNTFLKVCAQNNSLNDMLQAFPSAQRFVDAMFVYWEEAPFGQEIAEMIYKRAQEINNKHLNSHGLQSSAALSDAPIGMEHLPPSSNARSSMDL